MSETKKKDIEDYFFLLPIITSVVIIISFFFPIISVHGWGLYSNIYIWGIEDGNIGLFLWDLNVITKEASTVLFLPLIFFAIYLASIVIRLLLSARQLYLGKKSFDDVKMKWIRKGIMIIVQGVVITIVSYFIFSVVLGILGTEYHLNISDIKYSDFVTIGIGTFALFIAGAILVAGSLIFIYLLESKKKPERTK